MHNLTFFGLRALPVILACLAAGCTHPQVRLLEQGQLVQACEVEPFYTWYEPYSRRFSDALVAATDIRLRLSPLTTAELEAMAGQAPGELGREPGRLVRLELDVRSLGPVAGLTVALPVVFRGHKYQLEASQWTDRKVMALLPPLPELELSELPRFKPGKAPDEPTGVAAPNKAAVGVVQGLTMGLIKMSGRGPTRRELRRWRKKTKAFEAAEAVRKAAHEKELARITKVRAEQTAAHQVLVRTREALVARLTAGLKASCSQRSSDGAELNFQRPGRCLLTAPLTVEHDRHLTTATTPDRATLQFTPRLLLSKGTRQCRYQRRFQLKLPASFDIQVALGRAFPAGAIKLQDLPPDPPPFD